jgi:hypothetical protein
VNGPEQRSRNSDWLSRLLIAAGLLAVAVLLAVALNELDWSLLAVGVGCLAAQCLIAWRLARSQRRLLSVSALFAGLWVVYFPVRLAEITRSRDSKYYYEAVRDMTDQRLIWIWVLTTVGLGACLAGAWLVKARRRPRRRVDESALNHSQYSLIAAGGLVVSVALSRFSVSSGILANLGLISTLGIAGASYVEATGHSRRRWASAVLALIAVVIGYQTGFKENALLPVAAWIIGRVGAGTRIRVRYVAIAAVALIIAFGAIQGRRASDALGTPTRNPIAAAREGLTQYNVAYGVPSQYRGFAILENAVGGVLFRLKGADYFIAIVDRVPSVVPFQHGRSLWQPALSTVPAHQYLFNLSEDYSQLSLGRFVTRTFVSQQPTQDPSSQSMTFPGDLFLNFGSVGVVVGMLIFGLILGQFDRHFAVTGPLTAGLLAYVGLPLIGLDRNLAYVIVTAALRLGIAWVVLAIVLRTRVTTASSRSPRAPGSRLDQAAIDRES